MENVKKYEHLLEVRDLQTAFFTPNGVVRAVNGVSYYLDEGEVIAIVGESGCGKSVTQLSVTQLVQSPPGRILGGQVLFEGEDLLGYGARSRQMRAIRGAKISMIFQEPMTSLNPVLTVGNQLCEVIRTHFRVSRRKAWEIGVDALKKVGIPDPEARMKSYPFEMSGGMRQRVMIAIAYACKARVMIADEPTTALDVTTQAQVMEVLLSMVRDSRTALIVITHNLGLVTRYAQRIYVMYAGRIVESGTTEKILTNPKHPYTIGLLKSVPKLEEKTGEQLVPIQGAPPSLVDLPDNCAFYPRCPYACEKCGRLEAPPLRKVEEPEHYAACYLDVDMEGQ